MFNHPYPNVHVFAIANHDIYLFAPADIYCNATFKYFRMFFY